MSGLYDKSKAPPIEIRPRVDFTAAAQGLTVTKNEWVEFTHDLAAQLLTDEITIPFLGDRKLRQNHVTTLIEHMRRSTFRPEHVSLMTCSFEGKTYRMNGQHTCWARLEMPADWPCKVRLIQYEAASMDSMRQLYASIDRGSPRTKQNVVHSYLAGTSEFEMVPPWTVKLLPAGFNQWKHENSNDHVDGDTLAQLLKTEYYDAALRVCTLLENITQKPRFLLRGPVVAAMFATCSKNKGDSYEFWLPVSDGTGFTNKHDPRNTLREYLMQASVAVGNGTQTDRRKVSQEEMFRACILCWNAFREKRLLSVLKTSLTNKRSTVR